jgi:hypothetical protein
MFAVFSGRICKKFYKLSSSWSGINGKIFSGAMAICHSEFPGLKQAGGVRRFPYAGVSAGSFPGRHVPFFHFL